MLLLKISPFEDPRFKRRFHLFIVVFNLWPTFLASRSPNLGGIRLNAEPSHLVRPLRQVVSRSPWRACLRRVNKNGPLFLSEWIHFCFRTGAITTTLA